MGELFQSIKRGIYEAIAHCRGEKTNISLFAPEQVDVKLVREKTGLAQVQFALTFGISVGTLRHWAGGDRKPDDPALVLLNAVNKATEELLNILTPNSVLSQQGVMPWQFTL